MLGLRKIPGGRGVHKYILYYVREKYGISINPRASAFIRASVDAQCRDGTSEISRDPRTKRLQTRRESLARPSKHTNNNLLDSYLAVHKPSSFLPASSLPRENPLTRDFHNFVSSSSSLSSSSSSSVNPLSPY